MAQAEDARAAVLARLRARLERLAVLLVGAECTTDTQPPRSDPAELAQNRLPAPRVRATRLRGRQRLAS